MIVILGAKQLWQTIFSLTIPAEKQWEGFYNSAINFSKPLINS